MTIEDIMMRNQQLVLENEALRQHIEDLKTGFEGSCRTCELVGHMNKQLRKERDEARREMLMNEANHFPTMSDPRHEAKRRGWDCFKEKDK